MKLQIINEARTLVPAGESLHNADGSMREDILQRVSSQRVSRGEAYILKQARLDGAAWAERRWPRETRLAEALPDEIEREWLKGYDAARSPTDDPNMCYDDSRLLLRWTALGNSESIETLMRLIAKEQQRSKPEVPNHPAVA